MRIPFGKPDIQQAEIDEVADTLRSGWLVSGPKTRRFEEEFAEYTGAEHAIAVNSCTAALQLCLLASGVGHGDEVITPALTFVATANAIVNSGAVPVFADVDLETYNVDARTVGERLTDRTRAVLPVHLLGRPAPVAGIEQLVAGRDIAVVADAAHAVESHAGGVHVATLGTAAAFSFQATKSVATGDGGMITTADGELARKARALRSHGLDKDSWRRHGKAGDGVYDAVLPGFKYSLTDIASSIGIHQLRRVEANLATRERYVRRYDEAFADIPEVSIPLRSVPSGDRHGQHVYSVLLRTERLTISRDEFAAMLMARGIGCSVHYRVVHLSTYYRERFGFRRGDFPNAEHISDRTISLPLSVALTEADVDEVISAVRAIISANRRVGASAR